MSEKLPFYQRFNIILNQDEAREKFVNRAYHAFFTNLCPVKYDWHVDKISAIGAKLGTSDELTHNARDLIGMDFGNCLSAIEALYADSKDQVSKGDIDSQHYIERKLKEIFHESEHDLGIEWRDGQFWRTGAKVLDEKLVNENLKWLLDKEHTNIYDPFEKALRDYSESISRPEKLRDVVTNMYEALEATAKIVTRRETIDLSGNYQLFIKELGLSEQHKDMMRAYISYANEFRHGKGSKTKKMKISSSEAENFIYMTGIFIRFAIQKLEEQG